MYRYAPRFFNPIDPLLEPPMMATQFRGGPQRGPLAQDRGSMATGSAQLPQQNQGGGGMGLGEAAGAAGLLSKMGGGASPLAGLPKQAGLLGDPLVNFGGTPSLDAFIGAGKGAGEIGSFMGGIAGTGTAAAPFPAMTGGTGLLATGMTGADLGPMADLGLEAAGSGGSGLALSNPATAALAAPGILNLLGANVPDPIGGLLDLFGF